VEFRQLAMIHSSITQIILNFPRPEIIDFFFLTRFSLSLSHTHTYTHTHTHTHTHDEQRAEKRKWDKRELVGRGRGTRRGMLFVVVCKATTRRVEFGQPLCSSGFSAPLVSSRFPSNHHLLLQKSLRLGWEQRW